MNVGRVERFRWGNQAFTGLDHESGQIQAGTRRGRDELPQRRVAGIMIKARRGP
jgi:hypothetical protein